MAPNLLPIPHHPTSGADGPIRLPIGGTSARRPIDHEVGRVAARQHGLITLAQLGELGIGRKAVHKRCVAGRLHLVYVGVYAVGHRLLDREGELHAAVLACGSDAVLSHRSAGELWGVLEGPVAGPIDVNAPRRRGRAPAAIAAHRDGALGPADRLEVREIPCTTLPRTLIDLAGALSSAELRRAIGQAEILRRLDKDAVRRAIRRHRGRRGVARLRVAMDEIHPQTKRARSELERLFLHMCARAKLSEPEVNVWLEVPEGRYQADFLWRAARLIMEADSRRFHDTDSAFLNDRRRQQQLMIAGWRVAHCTWEQVEHEPTRLAQTIATLLASQRALT